MKKIAILKNLALSCFVLASPHVMAESLVDGAYFSAAGANGLGACKLVITGLGEESKYGDQLFTLESSGAGACEWSGTGLSKSFTISAGLISSGGVPAFVLVKFPFGPMGKRVELTSFNADGSTRNTETFLQAEADSVSAK